LITETPLYRWQTVSQVLRISISFSFAKLI